MHTGTSLKWNMGKISSLVDNLVNKVMISSFSTKNICESPLKYLIWSIKVIYLYSLDRIEYLGVQRLPNSF